MVAWGTSLPRLVVAGQLVECSFCAFQYIPGVARPQCPHCKRALYLHDIKVCGERREAERALRP